MVSLTIGNKVSSLDKKIISLDRSNRIRENTILQ